MPVPDEPTTAGAATMNAILRAPARRGATVYAGREPDRTTTNADAVAAVRAALAAASGRRPPGPPPRPRRRAGRGGADAHRQPPAARAAYDR